MNLVRKVHFEGPPNIFLDQKFRVIDHPKLIKHFGHLPPERFPKRFFLNSGSTGSALRSVICTASNSSFPITHDGSMGLVYSPT